MGLFKTIKKNSKHALSGHWGRAIGIWLITSIPVCAINLLEYVIRWVSGVKSFVDYAATPQSSFDDTANLALASLVVSLLVSLLLYALITPLRQGSARWFYRRSEAKSDRASEVFFYFEKKRAYFGSLWLHFQIGLRIILWGLLLMLPYFASKAYFFWLAKTGAVLAPRINLVWNLLCVIWALLTAMILAIISNKYYLAPYLFADGCAVSVKNAIKSSVQMTKGYKGTILTFYLSFWNWCLPALAAVLLFVATMLAYNVFVNMILFYIAAVFLGIQLLMGIYLYPYINMCKAVYARYLIETIGNQATPDRTREYDTHNPILTQAEAE